MILSDRLVISYYVVPKYFFCMCKARQKKATSSGRVNSNEYHWLNKVVASMVTPVTPSMATSLILPEEYCHSYHSPFHQIIASLVAFFYLPFCHLTKKIITC